MKYCNDYISLGNRSEFDREIAFDHHSDELLRVVGYDEATIVPAVPKVRGGVFDRDKKYVPWTEFWSRTDSIYQADTVVVDSREVFYLGTFYCCWGHCLTDDLRHLWPFVKGTVPSGVDLVYTTSAPDETLPENFLALLRGAGIDTGKIRRLEKPTRFAKVYCADPSLWLDPATARRYYTDEYTATINAIRAFYLPEKLPQDRKVYFSRSGWRGSKLDIGETHVERAFQSCGYEIHRPESVPFSEMLRILSSCHVFATTDGSCAHNAIFLPRGTHLVVIRKASYINDYQMLINQAGDLQVTNVDAFIDAPKAHRGEPWLGPFLLVVNDHLARFLNVRTETFRKDYFLYAVSYLKMRSRSMLSLLKRKIYGSLKSFSQRFVRRHEIQKQHRELPVGTFRIE